MNEGHKKIYESMSEHEHQRELFSWAAAAQRFGMEQACLWVDQHPQTLKRPKPTYQVQEDGRLRWMHAVPNGGNRGGDTKGRRIQGAKLKAEGVKQGVPDVFLPLPIGNYGGLYIEMKTVTGNLTKEQREFMGYARMAGYMAGICHGYREAIRTVLYYLGEEELCRKFSC